MKWVGQHIYDLIARFRNAVYLEGLTNPGPGTLKHLVLDTNNKIRFRTSAETLSDIGATGDITAVVFTTDSGASDRHAVDSGSANFSFLGSNGVGVTNSNEVLTFTAVPGEIDHDSLLNFAPNEHIDWTGASAGTIHSTNIPTLNQDTTGSSASCTGNSATATSLATARAINGVDFDGTAAITITAAGSTLSDTVPVSKGGTGQTTLTSNSVLTGNGTSGITAEPNLSYDGTNLMLTADGLGAPDIIIESTANHSSAGNLIFQKLRDDNSPADGGFIGTIAFNGEDTGLNTQIYGQIVGIQEETGAGIEGGKIKIRVATHDGELQDGIIVEDGDAEDEIDVTIANGASSLTTISGNLDVVGNVLPGITYVKILPSDFMPDDVGRPAMIDDTSSDRWLESHSTAKLYAYVDIPVGFKATHVDIYGSATSAVTVYEADINSKTVTSKGTGNIGTQINITDVDSDATNYILIELAQASGEEVYGGKLTIAKI